MPGPGESPPPKIAEQWTDWPASQRTGGPPASPIDETFMNRWRARHSSHVSRPAVPAMLIDTTKLPAFPRSWDSIGQLGEIYVPPWAVKLSARLYLEILAGSGSGIVLVRLRVGTEYSDAVTKPYVYTDGLDTQWAHLTVSVDVIPLRDQVVSCRWEYMLNPGFTGLVSLSFAYKSPRGMPGSVNHRRLAWWWRALNTSEV